MKVSKITITATIPVGQYANIQPSFELVDIANNNEAVDIAMIYIKRLWEQYGATPLREVKVKTSTDKINDLKL